METLLCIGLSNALAAAVLTLLAAGLGWLCRRPALTHSLWLLVLLKLITPPLLPIPLLPTDTPQPTQAADPSGLEGEPAPWPSPEVPRELAPEITHPPVQAEPPPVESAEPLQADDPAEGPRDPASWQLLLVALWLTGSVAWWTLAGLRLQRFRRLLRFARPGPPMVVEQARRLARQLGLAHCPGVWFVPAPLSPMLWALAGRPRLLLPPALWGRLSAEQQDTLLAHELAHLRRRDHWVRGLELVVLGLYWWHPVVWWARRELREAEEQCCDAWVVWALPAAAPAYAAALLETVAFLSQARPVLPLTASGIGPVHLLRRRLTMILRGTTSRTLSSAGFLAVLGLAAVLLPLWPTWAQTQPRHDADDQPAGQQGNPPEGADDVAPAPQADQPEQPTRYGQSPAAPQQGQRAVRPPRTVQQQNRAEQIEKLRDEIELLEVQFEVKQAQLAAAEQAVTLAMQRLKRVEQIASQGAISMEERERARTEAETQKIQLQVKRAELKEPAVLLKQARRRLARLEGQNQPQGQAEPRRTSSGRAAPAAGQSNRAAPDSAAQLGALQQQLNLTDRQREQLMAEFQRLQQELKSTAAQKDQLDKQMKEAEAQRARETALLEKLFDQRRQLELAAAKAKEDAAIREQQLRATLEQELAARKRKEEQAARAKQEYLKTHPDANREADQARLADLEKRLDALLREVEALRRDLKPGRTAPEKPRP
jgi:beta-lactamase regulating signal transducer with metallopeptidase domain